jgi:hypothetical protein
VQLRENGKITQAEVSFLLSFFSLHQITELDLMPEEVSQFKSIIENLQKAGLVRTEWTYHSVLHSWREGKQPVFRVEISTF